MDIFDRIRQQLSQHRVMLYMKGTPDFPQCGFSGRAVQILDACNAEYAFLNIFEEPEIRESLKQFSNWPTYPQLYIEGELVGGCDIMMELYESGELQQMLVAGAEDGAAGNPKRICKD